MGKSRRLMTVSVRLIRLLGDMGMPAAEKHDHDLLLIEALREGDAACLDEFIQRHDRWVRGVVYGVVGNASAVDDVMQKVWVSVWRRSKTLDDPRRWKTWLYRMARNAAIDSGRKVKRRRGLWTKLSEGFAGRPAISHDDPHRHMESQETHGEVMRAVEAMPAIYREPFVLRHLEGWTYKEIAETLEMPIDTVGTRLVRARRMLQDALEKKA